MIGNLELCELPTALTTGNNLRHRCMSETESYSHFKLQYKKKKSFKPYSE